MLRKSVATGLVVLLAGAGLALADASAPGKGMDLTGSYSIVSGEAEGQPAPADKIRDDVVRFTESTVTVTDKDRKETWSATYKIDPSTKPCRIMMTEKSGPNKGERARGLIEKQGDTVKLIYALPGGDMPTGFDHTKPKQLMFVLKRSKQ